MTRELSTFYNNYQLDFIEDANPIYHYTSFDAFKSIITNHKLRFTNRLFLNDYTEGKYILSLCIDNADKIFEYDNDLKKYFLEKCKTHLDDMETDTFQFYQCSFTVDGDNLPMWNYYSGNSGINIVFDRDVITKHYFQKVGYQTNIFNCGSVIYDKEKQLDIVKKIVLDFSVKFPSANSCELAEYIVRKLLYAGIFFKSKSYEIEKEYRITFELFSEDGRFDAFQTRDTNYEIEVMYSHGSIVPYVDVYFERSALKGITVPALVTKKEQTALKLFLNARGYNGDITVSKITKSF